MTALSIVFSPLCRSSLRNTKGPNLRWHKTVLQNEQTHSENSSHHQQNHIIVSEKRRKRKMTFTFENSASNLHWISGGKTLEIRLANYFMLPIYCSNSCPSFTSGHPIHIIVLFSLTPLIENLALLWSLRPWSGFDYQLGKGLSLEFLPVFVISCFLRVLWFPQPSKTCMLG